MNREIKALLILKGIKQVDIANRLGVSRAAVSVVVSGKGSSRRIKETIAKILNREMSSLWKNKAA